MEKIQKVVACVMAVIISIGCMGLGYTNSDASALQLSDVKEGDWFKANVETLANMGVINGYTDGTFKPNNTITKAQFFKVVVTVLGYKDIQMAPDYWAKNYINKMYEQGYTQNKYNPELDYEVPITRGEMAVIIAKVMDEEVTDSDIVIYTDEIKDISKVSGKNMLYIIQTYKNGIIRGYPDGEFKPGNNATRAEASTIIVRLLDIINDRQIPQVVSGTGGN